MNTKERLLAFINYKGISMAKFQQAVGVSSSYVQNIVNGIGTGVVMSIEENYPELNIKWLLTGEGEMINSEEDLPKQVRISSNSIPVLPISACAGSLTQFTAQVKDYECEFFVSPIADAQFVVTVSGDSMYPEYPSGSKVLVKKINEYSFIDWGRCYVLDTQNGIVIKKVFPSESEDSVTCVSINEAYPSFEIKKADIIGWYRVLMCVALK